MPCYPKFLSNWNWRALWQEGTEYSFRNEWLLVVTTEFRQIPEQSLPLEYLCQSQVLCNSMLSLSQVTKCSAVMWFLLTRTAVCLLSLVMTKVILFGPCPVSPPVEFWLWCRYLSLLLINNPNTTPLICLFLFPTSSMQVSRKLFWLLKSLILALIPKKFSNLLGALNDLLYYPPYFHVIQLFRYSKTCICYVN